MEKINKRNLTSKMVYRMVKDLLIGVVVFFILNFGAAATLQKIFLANGYVYRIENARIEQFQEYVTENKLKVTDTGKIRAWVEKENIREFVVSKGEKVYFDHAYQKDIFPGAIKKSSSYFLYPIDFMDGQAEIYIYNGSADKYYDIISWISVVASVLCCLMIFGNELQQEIKAIQYLQREVKQISSGGLGNRILLESYHDCDEISELAAGIDFMRTELQNQKITQEKMKQSQDELVLGMAHDLRTPLTGLFSYLEIIRKLEKEGNPIVEYIEKSMDKAEQLRTVSDQLFEYFLASNEADSKIEDPETVQSAFEDYLSEFCSFLQCKGFYVDVEELSWEPVKVQIHTDFLGRIMNNILSNIDKYADKKTPICIKSTCSQTHVIFEFENKIIMPNPYVKGTGIGLKNIDLMMKQMKGFSEVDITEDTYHIRLAFPIKYE